MILVKSTPPPKKKKTTLLIMKAPPWTERGRGTPGSPISSRCLGLSLGVEEAYPEAPK